MHGFRRVQMNPLEFVCKRDDGRSTGLQVLEEGQRRDVFYPAEGIKELVGKKM
jgi:hypothetical protein